MPFSGLSTIDLRRDDAGARADFERLCRRSAGLAGEEAAAAARIVADVRRRGDRAVVEATRRYEGRELTPEEFRLSRKEVERRAARVDADLAAALDQAADGIRTFHRAQRIPSTEVHRAGAVLQTRPRPLRRVAVYAPGGSAAYPSTVLMCAIPARVAGVPEVVLVTPRPTDAVLAAAVRAGVTEVLQLGGAQAVAAVAHGTETIRRVDKVVGPGNAYVTAAKRIVYGHVDIDTVAGPSEVLVVASEDAAPAFVAADLLAQAEHDRLACPLLVTWSERLVQAVDAALAELLDSLPRGEIAREALSGQGAAILVRDLDQAVDVANAYAPEHLELLVEDPLAVAERIDTAGAIFAGPWTPEAAGDYTAGPSHVLPTAGAARFASPLGTYDFVKYTSVLKLDRAALAGQAGAIGTLARAEGLTAHARSVEVRMETRS